MKPAIAALALFVLAAPALAQTPASPIQGKYTDVYVIAGRALDDRGLPVSGGTLVIELDQKGVRAEPLRAAANCKGDFITSFTLKHVDPKGHARITLLDANGTASASATVALDPFYRRSDATLHLPATWNSVCRRETNVWPVSASVSVRLLNRTEPYDADGEAFHAVPYTGVLRMRFETPDGNTICPPHPQDQTPGACETFVADERGDVRYTFTLDQAFEAGGRVDLLLQEGGSLDVPIDPVSRIGVKYFEVTGRGAPPELYKTPGLGLVALALALCAAVALRARR